MHPGQRDLQVEEYESTSLTPLTLRRSRGQFCRRFGFRSAIHPKHRLQRNRTTAVEYHGETRQIRRNLD